jgi:hypothetical protein
LVTRRKDVFEERYRRALLEIDVAGTFSVEPPDPRYPYREPGPVRIDLDIERGGSEKGIEKARFYVDPWNSFIVVEAQGALLTWLDLPEREDGASP